MRKEISLVELKNKYFNKTEFLKEDIAKDTICVKCGKYNEKDIMWLVCDVRNNNEVLLLSEKGLCKKAYNDKDGGKSFEQSSLSNWLNNDFLKNSIFVEKDGCIGNAIVKMGMSAYIENVLGDVKIPMYMTLLTKEQAKIFFKVEENSKSESGKCYMFDNDTAIDWWLSSNLESDLFGCGSHRAYYVNTEGSLCSELLTANNLIYVRPAMWVDLSKM